MSIIKFIPESVILDDRQKVIADQLEVRAIELQEQSLFDQLKKKFFADNDTTGIYLHGGVGRGKTMLMNAFYELITLPKEIVHYQSFMEEIHKSLHQLQGKSDEMVMENLADLIYKRAKILCIDEFEIKDITDAMLIMRIFNFLIEREVFIVLTTNTVPDNLYKDGLQRELFLPFIDMVKKGFEVMLLDNNKDYRFEKICNFEQRIFFPLNADTKKKITEIKSDLAAGSPVIPRTIDIFGRDVKFDKVHKDCLFTSFTELIDHNFGYSDYINICKEFNVIVLEDVPIIGELETDKIIRFINFIDNAYFYKVMLFITLEKSIEEIYIRGHKQVEFQRTISRLTEMNSTDYLHDPDNEYGSN